MTITVAFKGYLKQYTGHREPVRLELAEDAQLEAVFAAFKIPPHLVKFASMDGTGSMLPKDYALADGDYIVIHPVVLGG